MTGAWLPARKEDPRPPGLEPGVPEACWCGDVDCAYLAWGFLWCRPCDEHHRPPECAIDSSGCALAPCGCRWSDLDEKELCPHLSGG